MMIKQILIFVVVLFMTLNVAIGQRFSFFTVPIQSAKGVGMITRESTTEADAVFYNPAGLTKLSEGLHISVNNQFPTQNTKVTNDYIHLNTQPTEYNASVGSLVFPSVYATLKNDRFAYWVGINPIAGAGTGEYTAVPEADMGIADMIPIAKWLFETIDQEIDENDDNMINGSDPGYRHIDGYRMNFNSTGVAAVLGAQAGFSYKINDIVSVSVGGRFVYARVDAGGYTNQIEINSVENGGWQDPIAYMTNAAADPNVSNFMKTLMDEIILPEASKFLAPRDIDVEQTGNGFTHIFGINISPNDRINFGMKYETKTILRLKTKVNDGKDGGVNVDGTPIFTDGEIIRADLPAVLSTGVSVKMAPKLMTTIGGRYLFTENTNLNGREKHITGNDYEIGMGFQYEATPWLVLRTSGTYKRPSVAPEYQNDVDFKLPAYTVTGGATVSLGPVYDISFGCLYTKSISTSYAFTRGELPEAFQIAPIEQGLPYNQSYSQNAFILAIGLDAKFPNF